MEERQVMDELGEEGIAAFVSAFYRRVRSDDLVGPMYPANDWQGSEERLRDFLVFRFGGPDRYIRERGHPRLRMRHIPFAIGEKERDRWLMMMGEALDECSVTGPVRDMLDTFFSQTADFMRNQPG